MKPSLRHGSPILAALAVLSALPGPFLQEAAGQRNPADGTILGQVLDELRGTGIPGADVEFLDALRRVRGRAVTDGEGHFGLFRLPPGAFQLRVRALGYAETITPTWWVQTGEILTVALRLRPDAILLAPLEVKAVTRSFSPVLEGFYRRMERGVGGVYFDREEIQRRGPTRITDLLVDVPGVRLETAFRSGGPLFVVSFARSPLGRGGGLCPVQVFVDGILASRGQAVVPLDELASPAALEGMEVYRGLSSVPAEFVTPDARCGVIALWTQRGR